MSVNREIKRITTHTLMMMKSEGQKISMLTAYDYSFAKIIDESGIDVILVGECRDVETARIAVQSALTGHFVLSTIHATDSVAALHRLLDTAPAAKLGFVLTGADLADWGG